MSICPHCNQPISSESKGGSAVETQSAEPAAEIPREQEPQAWLYERPGWTTVATPHRWLEMDRREWTETPLYAAAPVDRDTARLDWLERNRRYVWRAEKQVQVANTSPGGPAYFTYHEDCGWIVDSMCGETDGPDGYTTPRAAIDAAMSKTDSP